MTPVANHLKAKREGWEVALVASLRSQRGRNSCRHLHCFYSRHWKAVYHTGKWNDPTMLRQTKGKMDIPLNKVNSSSVRRNMRNMVSTFMRLHRNLGRIITPCLGIFLLKYGSSTCNMLPLNLFLRLSDAQSVY